MKLSELIEDAKDYISKYGDAEVIIQIDHLAYDDTETYRSIPTGFRKDLYGAMRLDSYDKNKKYCILD